MTHMSTSLYRITFLNHGKIYILYCRYVGASHLWGFNEIGDFVFDLRNGLVIDPTEERLREEFSDTKMLHLPIPSIMRIEEVKKKGQSTIRDAATGENVITPFPLPGKPR